VAAVGLVGRFAGAGKAAGTRVVVVDGRGVVVEATGNGIPTGAVVDSNGSVVTDGGATATVVGANVEAGAGVVTGDLVDDGFRPGARFLVVVRFVFFFDLVVVRLTTFFATTFFTTDFWGDVFGATEAPSADALGASEAEAKIITLSKAAATGEVKRAIPKT
jgi:hypothetical protein